jgi:PAS domain S-box-containing protein
VTQHDHEEEPYRRLFLQLPQAAARCRIAVEGGRLLRVELVDENAAFAPHRGELRTLLEACVEGPGPPGPREVQIGGETLEVTVVPVGGDEVMVLIQRATPRTELELRLRETQNRFEQAFHGNAAAMVIARQTDLRILDVNRRWLELFGASRDEVIGRTSVELGLITEARASARIAEHRLFGKGFDREIALQTRAGADLIVLASARPIAIFEGPCTLTTLIDITAHKRAEEAFAVAFNSSPAGMMLVDVGSDLIVEVNGKMLGLMAATRADLVGRRVAEVQLTLQPRREELLAEITSAGRLDAVEVELATARGGVWTLASAELVTLQGRPHRLSVFTDISARKRFERQLLTQHAIGRGLAEARDLDVALPSVLETLCRSQDWDGGVVWLADEARTWRCAWLDPAAADAIAEPLAAVPTEAMWAQLRAGGTAAVTSSPAPELRALAQPILRGGDVIGAVVLVARRDREPFDAAERGLYDSVGRLLGLFVERARAESSLRELNSELEARVAHRTRALETSNRDLVAFASSLSHDLRSPLRAIHGFSAILREDHAAALPADALKLLARIESSAERMRDLIDSVLAFAQLGHERLVRTDVALDPMVHSVLEELLVERGRTERLELRVAPLGSCRADPSLLRTVWTNLIDNALKYARPQGLVVIEIGRELRAGEVVYHVADNGVGFDMRYADKLFGVFQRLHGAEFEGTGIGLANVRRIVERHDGWIAAASEVGRGSRFEFALGPEPG